MNCSQHEFYQLGCFDCNLKTKEQETKLGLVDKAIAIINGPRRDSYGPVEESFKRIAVVWSELLGHNITASQVSIMMIAFKLCREANKHSEDNLVDIIGYTLLHEKLVVSTPVTQTTANEY